jgi:hypothetical protein
VGRIIHKRRKTRPRRQHDTIVVDAFALSFCWYGRALARDKENGWMLYSVFVAVVVVEKI